MKPGGGTAQRPPQQEQYIGNLFEDSLRRASTASTALAMRDTLAARQGGPHDLGQVNADSQQKRSRTRRTVTPEPVPMRQRVRPRRRRG
jgi:hypothetical protein